LLIIACEDVGIAALRAVVMTASRCANVKALRDTGKDEAAALATAQMLAEVPKDRSADLLFAVVLHDPTLEIMRSKCRSASVARRLEFVADPTLSLPERALAVWHSSGVESYGEPRVGPGDLGALMRTYAELGVPERLLEAVAEAIKKVRDPFALLLPLLWLGAAGSETELANTPLAPSGLINGVPLYALDKHTRLGNQAIKRFAQENAEIAQFLTERGCGSGNDGALRMAVLAQLQHNMWVVNARLAALSIITGGGKWVEMAVPADPLYQHFLITAERRFWRCVETGETPRPYGVEPPRARVEAVRIVDMSGSNSWAQFAGLFCATRSAFSDHERAKAELKGLMPEDAKEASGHGVRAKRSKSGAVNFDLLAQEDGHAAV
jgi:hypothetical protein